MESEARLYEFDLTRFLHANRYPSPGQARGHASLENALTSATLRHEHSMTNMTPFSIARLGQHPDAVSLGGMFYNRLWVTLGNANACSVFRGAAYWANGKASTSTATVTIPAE
jgi:hypothetical protein